MEGTGNVTVVVVVVVGIAGSVGMGRRMLEDGRSAAEGPVVRVSWIRSVEKAICGMAIVVERLIVAGSVPVIVNVK